jgi:cardiolipin synthase
MRKCNHFSQTLFSPVGTERSFADWRPKNVGRGFTRFRRVANIRSLRRLQSPVRPESAEIFFVPIRHDPAQLGIAKERLTEFDYFRQVVFSVCAVVFSSSTSLHAVLHKRDHRSAVMWVAFIWFSLFLGAILYIIFGVNRVRRRAAKLKVDGDGRQVMKRGLFDPEFTVGCFEFPENLSKLRTLGDTVTGRPLIGGNSVQLLENGDAAFPAILDSIRSAERTISLSSYIFDHDAAGEQFVAAKERGVEIRVLVDDVGARYSRPPINWTLSRQGIPNARFLPQVWFLRFAAMNLRSHRKILVVDGRVAFVGGMNIRHGNCLSENPQSPIRNVHFQVCGPVVEQLQRSFVADWEFCTGEELIGEDWFPQLKPSGNVAARVITDGPDTDIDRLTWMLLGAMSCAQESLWIVTPYFLPNQPLIASITTAGLRGVKVNIVLPANNNLKIIHAASRAAWWQLLERGCRIWLTEGAFDHSKIMIVDNVWSLVGSANWDARSLRLNFEINLESYDTMLAAELLDCIEQKLEYAHEVTLEEVNQRKVDRRVIDGAARLFNPFL